MAIHAILTDTYADRPAGAVALAHAQDTLSILLLSCP